MSEIPTPLELERARLLTTLRSDLEYTLDLLADDFRSRELATASARRALTTLDRFERLNGRLRVA